MRLYLGPESSLELIRYLRSVNGSDGLEGAMVRKRILNDAINTVRGIRELDAAAQGWLSHVNPPIRAFVADKSRGTSTKQLVTRVFGQDVPYGAFLNLGHGVCICTPAFTFMGLAPSMSAPKLLQVGMEFCGSYSRWRLAPPAMPGISQTASDEDRHCTYGVPPVLNAKRLEAFIEHKAGLRGVVSARGAVRWLANYSASPMETAVYLLLCLPRRLGGYGLPRPALNPKLTISNPDGPKVRYPDLFWLGPNIDVEYNSDSSHSGTWARYHDSRREVELTVGDVRVLPLTRAQLMDVDGFDDFAHGLRRMLGVRSRTPDANWSTRRDKLRETLLASGK